MKAKEIKLPRATKDTVVVVRLGSDERPATSEDLERFQSVLSQAAKRKDVPLTIVSHHLVDFMVMKRTLLKDIKVCSSATANEVIELQRLKQEARNRRKLYRDQMAIERRYQNVTKEKFYNGFVGLDV